MENAAKALLIAGGILIGLIVVSLMIVGHRQVADYYRAREEAIKFEQLSDFNEQYTPYYRDDVRGSDLISLVNKIIDFNALNPEDEPITIRISIPNNSESQMIYYDYSDYNDVQLVQLGRTYTQDTIDDILNPATRIESRYTPQGMAAKLTSNISTLLGENRRKTRNELLQELKIDYTVNDDDILRYYQYQQFKRAHFRCTQLDYTEDGRVQSFIFIFNNRFE